MGIVRAFSLSILLALCAAAQGALPTGKELGQTIREAGLDPLACFHVRDLSYSKGAIRLYFNEGYLIFSRPVMGQRLVAVFTTEIEGGDGEVLLIPPSRSERQSLASFTKSPTLDEHLRDGLLIFTDLSGNTLLDQLTRGEGGRPAPEMGPLLAGQWNPVVANITQPLENRVIEDLLSTQAAEKGMVLAAVSGRSLGAFDLISDGRAEHRIAIRQSRGSQDGYDVWSSFLPRGTAAFRDDGEVRPLQYDIHAEIGADLQVKAASKLTLIIGPKAVRAIPLQIDDAMKIGAVRLDGLPAEILSDSVSRGRVSLNGNERRMLVIAPEFLAPGSEHHLEIEHAGHVIQTRGNGVYFVEARGSWYPHMGGQRSLYDVTFRYPKRLTLVTAGEMVEDRSEGEWRTTRRRPTKPIGSFGFNLGSYEKLSGTSGGVSFEVYGNRNLEEALRPRTQMPIVIPMPLPPGRAGTSRIPVRMDVPPPPVQPDPLARLRTVAEDLSSSLEYFRGMLGPPVLNTLTVAPIPGTFGQGFPGLVYLSTFAYLDPRERPLALRQAKEQVFFSDLIVPHEAAHQWWGGIVAVASPEDEWLLEALANYSALLWLEKKKGPRATDQVLDGYRQELLAKDDAGHVVDSIGPIVWGYRLDQPHRLNNWRVITYGKGTWILHMLRKRMGDVAFVKLLTEVRKRYESHPLSTAGFAALAREVRPQGLSPESIDSFFENWVYATGIPSLKLNSSVNGLRLTGSIEQSNVEDDFSVDVPVEVRYPHGASDLIWVRTSSERKTFSVKLKQIPARVSIPEDILMRR